MLQSEIKKESMLFVFETTYKSDYRHGEIREYPKTIFKPKPIKERPEVFRNLNLHSMTEWKGVPPPFSLTHAPKDIVRTNPYTVVKPFEKQEDVDREMVQKTRPRLVMTPAVSMDDIADPTARKILCTDMYTSDMSRGMREAFAAAPPQVHVKAPLPGLPAPADPVSIALDRPVERHNTVSLAKLQPPLVSPEWRMESASWDGRQLRGHCDPTREYWLARPTVKCRACEESAAVSAHRKMQRKLKS